MTTRSAQELETKIRTAADELAELKTANDVRRWWNRHYYVLGHRRLGRLLLGQSVGLLLERAASGRSNEPFAHDEMQEKAVTLPKDEALSIPAHTEDAVAPVSAEPAYSEDLAEQTLERELQDFRYTDKQAALLGKLFTLAAPDPIEEVESELLREEMDTALNSLTVRERRVMELRFGLVDGRSRTLEEVGRDFGVTRERIRQIQAKALGKLRDPILANRLRDFLD